MASEEDVKFKMADQVEVTNPNSVKAVYANNIGAAGTSTDFRLFFNELGTSPEASGGRQTQEVRAIVTLPIGIAVGLIEVLKQIIGNHQEMTQLAADERAKQ